MVMVMGFGAVRNLEVELFLHEGLFGFYDEIERLVLLVL